MDPAGLKSGSRLGAYTVLKKLGEGGMSLVYLAEHSTLGRLVALKVLRAEFSGNADAVQRFFLEARAVNQIRHPHIVDITDFSANEGGEAYYVMEFMEGADVEGLLDKRQITLLRAIEIAKQAASALEAVHEAGVVHRDFKCGNVFVTTDSADNDWVKVIDFGIAKLNDPHSRRIGDTLEGVAAGTPEYISPEQALAKEVDARSDIYSFGVFLYQMVTGLVPFRGKDANEIVRKHLYERARSPRRVKGLPHAIPRALDDLIMRCLAKKPERRPQTMKDIQDELSMIADTVRYELALRQRRWLRAAVVATICMALVVGSAGTDALLGERPGRTALSLASRVASATRTTLTRVRENEVAVAAAAVFPMGAAPTPAAVIPMVTEPTPASAPASAPITAPAPAVETEKVQIEKPKRHKKHRH